MEGVEAEVKTENCECAVVTVESCRENQSPWMFSTARGQVPIELGDLGTNLYYHCCSFPVTCSLVRSLDSPTTSGVAGVRLVNRSCT